MMIHALMKEPGDDSYYDDGFRIMIESHLDYLRHHPDTTLLEIKPFDTYKYEGDLTGLLDQYVIPRPYQWVVQILNNIRSGTDVNENLMSVLVPSTSVIDSLRRVYLTKESNL